MNKHNLAVVYALVSVVVAMLILVPNVSSYLMNPIRIPLTSVPESRDISFQRTFVIDAPSSAPPTSYVLLNLSLPIGTPPDYINLDYSSFQNVTVSYTPSGSLHEAYNRRWVSWYVSPADDIIVKLNYTAHLKTKVWDIYPENSGTVDDIPQFLKDRYLKSEAVTYNDETVNVIDINKFHALAVNLTSDKATVVEKLRAIYDFMVKYFKYDAGSGGLKSVYETFRDRAGDCDELSFVYASIARSVGIPVWLEYGLLYTGKTVGPHAWIQTYIPDRNGGGAFVNIDLTAEVGRENLGRGFLIRSADHITEWIEDGNEAHLTKYYEYIRTNVDISADSSVSISSSSESEEEVMIPASSIEIPYYFTWLIMAIGILYIVYITTKMPSWAKQSSVNVRPPIKTPVAKSPPPQPMDKNAVRVDMSKKPKV